MWHYCNSCGEWSLLDSYTAMCRGCSDTWSDTRSRTLTEIKAEWQALGL